MSSGRPPAVLGKTVARSISVASDGGGDTDGVWDAGADGEGDSAGGAFDVAAAAALEGDPAAAEAGGAFDVAAAEALEGDPAPGEPEQPMSTTATRVRSTDLVGTRLSLPQRTAPEDQDCDRRESRPAISLRRWRSQWKAEAHKYWRAEAPRVRLTRRHPPAWRPGRPGRAGRIRRDRQTADPGVSVDPWTRIAGMGEWAAKAGRRPARSDAEDAVLPPDAVLKGCQLACHVNRVDRSVIALDGSTRSETDGGLLSHEPQPTAPPFCHASSYDDAMTDREDAWMPSTRPCRPAGDRPPTCDPGISAWSVTARSRVPGRGKPPVTVTGTRPDKAAARRPWTTASAVSPIGPVEGGRARTAVPVSPSPCGHEPHDPCG